MVGNVTGVSLLETVGTPAPQAGAGSVPGQNFAAVMQQAGNEAGTSLPSASSVSGPYEKEQAAERDPSAASGAPAQSDIVKAGATAESGRVGQFARKTGTGPQSNIQFATWSGAGTVQNVLSRLPAVLPVNPASSGVASPVVATEEPAVPTPGVLVAEVAVPADLAAALNKDGVANGVIQGAGKDAVSLQPVTVPKKSGKETVSLESKPAAKPVDAKGDSKLTAAIPQGAAAVPQSDASVAGLNGAATMVAPVLPVPVDAGSVEAKNVEDGLATSVTELPSASGRKVLPQAGEVSLSGTSAEAAPNNGTASTPGFDNAMARAAGTPGAARSSVKVFAGNVPQDAEPVVSGAAMVGKRGVAPLTAVVSAQTADAVLAQVGQGQPPVLKARTLETASAGAQSLVGGTVAAGTAKQALSAAKKVQDSGKSAVEALTAATPVAQGVPSGPTALPATATVAKPWTEQAVAAVAGRAPAAKIVDAVRGSATQSKTAAAPDDSAPAASKETGAPTVAASAQPAASAADHSGFAASVTVPVVAANSQPHLQTTAPSAVASGGVAEGIAAAGQTGTASGASLPHTTLSSTPTSLEVGVSSGTHGWLKIRAELNAAGEVNASLTGASTAAAEKLRGDLPALSSYLQAEKVPVGVLDVRSAVHTATASFDGGSTFSQTGQGTGHGQTGSGQTGQGSANGTSVSADAGTSGGRAQQQAHQDTTALSGVDGVGVVRDKVLPGRTIDTAAYGIHTELGGNEGSPSVGYGTGGGWLNVRA